jgi:hypothetical protein
MVGTVDVGSTTGMTTLSAGFRPSGSRIELGRFLGLRGSIMIVTFRIVTAS